MIENYSDKNRGISESEERFRALVTATSDVVYRMSPDWSVMRQLEGGSFLSDTGEPDGDWLQKYIHPLDQERVKTAIAEAIRDKKMFQLEHRVLQADGTLGWTASRAVPILDKKEKSSNGLAQPTIYLRVSRWRKNLKHLKMLPSSKSVSMKPSPQARPT